MVLHLRKRSRRRRAAGRLAKDRSLAPVDVNGAQLAGVIDPQHLRQAHLLRPASFEVKLVDGSTQITVMTGSKDGLASISLETPSPFFIRAAQVEVSDDNASWSTLDQGVPLFRQWGAERLELPLRGRAAAFVRITVADMQRLLNGAAMNIPRCDKPPFVFLGLSMAGWNAVISLILSLLSVAAFRLTYRRAEV